MGIFDVFGAGGGHVKVLFQNPTAEAGGILAGEVTFTAGKRVQQIKVLTGRLICSIANPKGAAQIMEVVPTFEVAGGFVSKPGEVLQFPFQVQVPPNVQGSVPNAVSYTFSASADIDGEIDPSDSAGVNIVGGQGYGYSQQAAPAWNNQGYVQPDVYAGAKSGKDAYYGGDPKGGKDASYGGDPKGAYDDGGGKGGSPLGAHCQAQWTNGQWYGATVLQSNGGQYLVRWDDGSPDLWVNGDQIAQG